MLNKRKASKIHWASDHAVQITWMDGTVSWFHPTKREALLTEYSFTSRISSEVATSAIAQYVEQQIATPYVGVRIRNTSMVPGSIYNRLGHDGLLTWSLESRGL